MKTFFSILRYISLVILVTVILGNTKMNMQIPIWLGVIYPVIIFMSFLEFYFWERKYSKKNRDFVAFLIMADIVTPLNYLWDTARATRIWNIWYFRKPKRRHSKRKFKDIIITGIIRMIIIVVVLMIGFVIVSLVA